MLQATVTAITGNSAHLLLTDSRQQQCEQCQQGKGCQSFSLYQWLYGNQPIAVPNAGYQINQQLSIQFPRYLLLNSIGLMLGTPLLAFLIGIFSSVWVGEGWGFLLALTSACATGYYTRRAVKQRLLPTLQISTIQTR